MKNTDPFLKMWMEKMRLMFILPFTLEKVKCVEAGCAVVCPVKLTNHSMHNLDV